MSKERKLNGPNQKAKGIRKTINTVADFTEQEMMVRLQNKKIEATNKCSEEVNAILDKYNCALTAEVLISGQKFSSRVVVNAK